MLYATNAELAVMARVLRYRFFNADITPTNLFMDLWKAVGHQWKDSKVANWNRPLVGPLLGSSFCFACKIPRFGGNAIGIMDTCSICYGDFQRMPPGPQAMLLSTAHDARLMLYTYDWLAQQHIFHQLVKYTQGDAYHGILPQSYQQRVSQEDVQYKGTFLLDAPDTTQLPAEI